MFSNLEESLLRRLVKAEHSGKPLTFEQLGMETRGSSFEDLWARMYIVVVGQERNIVSVANTKSQLVASPEGKWWLAKLDAERAGKSVPPYPKAQTVYL